MAIGDIEISSQQVLEKYKQALVKLDLIQDANFALQNRIAALEKILAELKTRPPETGKKNKKKEKTK